MAAAYKELSCAVAGSQTQWYNQMAAADKELSRAVAGSQTQ